MPTRKLPDETKTFAKIVPCQHPDHNVPSHQVFAPGLYEHECSGCGRKHVFRVNAIVCDSSMIEPEWKMRGRLNDDTNPMHAFGHGRGD